MRHLVFKYFALLFSQRTTEIHGEPQRYPPLYGAL